MKTCAAFDASKRGTQILAPIAYAECQKGNLRKVALWSAFIVDVEAAPDNEEVLGTFVDQITCKVVTVWVCDQYEGDRLSVMMKSLF